MGDIIRRLCKTENLGLIETIGQSHVITFAKSLFS